MTLAERIKKAVEDVRLLAKEYAAHQSDKKQKIRAETYKLTGSFGKIMFPFLDTVHNQEVLLEKSRKDES
jgi:hypothetical protein